MRKYWLNFSNSLQSMGEYRLSLGLDILGNFISNLVVYLFWYFLATAGMNTGDYNATSLGIYFLLVSVISAASGFDAHNVSQDIRDGEVTQFLLKPVNYMWLKFSASFPHNLLKLLVGILIFLSLGLFGFTYWISLSNLILFFVAVIFSVIGNHLVYFIAGLAAFWMRHVFGIAAMVSVGSSLVSGRIIPIDLLPPAIAGISTFLPFRYLIFFPAQIFMGKLTFGEIVIGLATELFWLVFLYVVSKVIWQAGQKQLEAVGI